MSKCLLSCVMVWMAVAAAADPFMVNTADDVSDPGDGTVSLRSALAATMNGDIRPNDGNDCLITFGDGLFTKSDSVTVSLSGSTPIRLTTGRITIRGRTDGKRVTLAVTGASQPVISSDAGVDLSFENLDVRFDTDVTSAGTPSAGVFLKASGSFAFRDLSFTGGGSKNGYLVSSVGTLTNLVGAIERCSFTGARCGTLCLRGNHRYRLVNDTFSDIMAADEKGVVQLDGGGSANSLFVSCTMAYCSSPAGGLSLPATSHSGSATNVIANSLFYGNLDSSFLSVCDINAASPSLCAYSAYGAVTNRGCLTEKECTDVSAYSADQIFGCSTRSVWLDGACLAYRPVRRGSCADRAGAFILHDEDWLDVVAVKSLRRTGTGYGFVLAGNPSGAGGLLDSDILTRRVWTSSVDWQASSTYAEVPDLRATSGSYATVTDVESSGEPGLCEVNDLADSTDSDPYDGALSLREAAESVLANHGWRDAEGNARIVFAESALGTGLQRTIAFAERQISFGGVGRGTLSVCGSTNLHHRIVLDGGGLHRFFHVKSGNRVELCGFSFTNAVAEIAGDVLNACGGALYNEGHVTVRDCSFAGCSASACGNSRGGAIANAAGATAIVERCSFTGCTATEGGALANAAGGTVVAYASSFCGNRAGNATGGIGANGGAVYAQDGARRTALVNCTVAGNEALHGGGVWAAGATTNLYLLNAIVVGNGGEGAGCDVWCPGPARVRTSWLGDCDDVSQLDADGDVTRFGMAPADVFAKRGAYGAAVPECECSSVVNVWHAFLAVANTVRSSMTPSDVLATPDWSGVWFSEEESLWNDGAASATASVRNDDLFGPVASGVTFPGSSNRYADPETSAPSGDDPLRVTAGTEDAFRAAVRYAAEHPSSASNGYMTVSFAEGLSIALSEPLVLSEFTTVPLRLAGPVTFTCGGANRLFTVCEGNGLVLANVTLYGGYDLEKGGGAYVESGTLAAFGCTFANCTTGTGSDGYCGMGGAVALWTNPDNIDAPLPSATFEDCSFVSCAAGAGTCGAFGDDVYQPLSTCSVFRRCTFDGANAPDDGAICVAPCVCVEQESGNCYYGAVTAALDGGCQAGDTLVRISSDALVPDDTTLPPGVSYRDDTGETVSSALLTSVRTALVAANRGYYSAEMTTDSSGRATGIRVALNEDEVKPVVTGEGASVDLAATSDCVSIVPANVKPGLWYGLGRSATPTGDFTVETWIQADENGLLPSSLTARKTGASGFYRVRVSDVRLPQP